MVGFGVATSAEHELDHMLNYALGLGKQLDAFLSVRTDVDSPTDSESIAQITGRHYELFVNSLLKDELIARIDNEQIFKVVEQPDSERYVLCDGKLFSSYRPRHLYEHISTVAEEVREFGVEPVSKEQYREFKDRYDQAADPIRLRWLGAYNEVVRAIHRVLAAGHSSAVVKATILSAAFEDLAARLESVGQ